jgi:secreted protein with Ig-like and vWFA domain
MRLHNLFPDTLMNFTEFSETIESRMTAWALGELPPDEAVAFEAAMAADPVLAAEAERTKAFCGVLDGNLAQAPVVLARAERERLLSAASAPVVVPFSWRRGLTALAACVAAGTAGTMWYQWTRPVSGVVLEAPRMPVAGMLPGGGGGVDPGLEVGFKKMVIAQSGHGGPPVDSKALPAPVVTSGPAGATVREQSGGLKSALSDDFAPSPGAGPTPASARVQESDMDAPTGGLAVHDLKKNKNQEELAVPAAEAPVDGLRSAEQARSRPMEIAASAATPMPSAAPNAESRWKESGHESMRGALAMKPQSAAAGAGADRLGGLRRWESDEYSDGEGQGVGRRLVMPVGSADSAKGSESYQALPENPWVAVGQAPLSTFSIDVDTASYANVRRFLNRGGAPPPEAVRLEELVNYFPYSYAPPVDGKPFAVHVEMTSAPWNARHRIARIALKGKEIHAGERPAANLVFLVDVSGSMQDENKLPLVKQSLRFVVDRLTEKDTVSLVTYAGESGVVLPATSGGDKARITAAIESLGAGGSTNGAGGITSAYAEAARNFRAEGINRVILASDGDFNVGVTSHEQLQQLITDKAKTGVFLSVLGYGMGNTKDDTMELLADKGNGNYAYIDSLSEARKALGEQFSGTLVTIAKDVKIQIEFNPAKVGRYRLLGYENRMLAKEDFNDDRKDAGEIGAGHTVTALYEIIPAGVADEPVVTEKLKYQPAAEAPPAAAPVPAATVTGPVSDETMTVKLRWKAHDKDVSELMEVPVKDAGTALGEAGPETRWALSVAGFASMLRHSQFAGMTWNDIRSLAASAKGDDPHGYRGEFLQLIDRAASTSRR